MEVPECERCIGAEGEVHPGVVQLLRVGEAVPVPVFELPERIGMAKQQPGDTRKAKQSQYEVEVAPNPGRHVRDKVVVEVQQVGVAQESHDAVCRAGKGWGHPDVARHDRLDHVVGEGVRHVHQVFDAVDSTSDSCPVALGAVRMGGDLEAVLMRHADDLADPLFRQIGFRIGETQIAVHGGDLDDVHPAGDVSAKPGFDLVQTCELESAFGLVGWSEAGGQTAGDVTGRSVHVQSRSQDAGTDHIPGRNVVPKRQGVVPVTEYAHRGDSGLQLELRPPHDRVTRLWIPAGQVQPLTHQPRTPRQQVGPGIEARSSAIGESMMPSRACPSSGSNRAQGTVSAIRSLT